MPVPVLQMTNHPEGSTGIVRYDAASTSDPTSVSAFKALTTRLDELLKAWFLHEL